MRRAIIYVRSLKEFYSDMLHADRLLRLRAIKCKQIGGDEGEADADNLRAWASRLGMYRIGARLHTRGGAKTPTNKPQSAICPMSDCANVGARCAICFRNANKVDMFEDKRQTVR
jgi:hypothetical protein